MEVLDAALTGSSYSLGQFIFPKLVEQAYTVLASLLEACRGCMAESFDPLDAFLGGKMLVTGDMALVMQIQAIQMQAAQGAF